MPTPPQPSPWEPSQTERCNLAAVRETGAGPARSRESLPASARYPHPFLYHSVHPLRSNMISTHTTSLPTCFPLSRTSIRCSESFSPRRVLYVEKRVRRYLPGTDVHASGLFERETPGQENQLKVTRQQKLPRNCNSDLAIGTLRFELGGRVGCSFELDHHLCSEGST
eukprot:2547687-Rhodomonas_salina.1